MKIQNSKNPPKRKTPEYLYSPFMWNQKELQTFCYDLDMYTMDAIQQMYGLEKPINLKLADKIRSAALSRGICVDPGSLEVSKLPKNN